MRTQCADGVEVNQRYVIATRATYVDFFTRKGRAAQIAPVPLQPDQVPTQPMMTLSTCATQEDHKRGDRRRDRFGNPPGRWVVVAVLR